MLGAFAFALALPACGAWGEGTDLAVPELPTFASHVAEILYRDCLSCHHQDGAAPFALADYEDARARAELIAKVTREGTMPPWLPAPGDVRFVGERRLPDRDVEILQRWALAGAPEGDLEEAPDPPDRQGGWVLGEPDLILEMERPYTVPAGGEHGEHGGGGTGRHQDVFRNFVIRVPVDETKYVRGVELQPGSGGVLHHAILSVDATPASRDSDLRDLDPGFDGMFARTGARPPGGFFVGWTPGLVPRLDPEGLAWPLQPGTDLVIQAHLRPQEQPTTVRLRVGLHFGAEPERTPLLLHLTGRTIRIPAGEPAYTVEDRFELPVAVEILALYPHAHHLARTVSAQARLPDGTEMTLLRIDDWDFEWQETYSLEAPLPLPAGTELRMRYVYDNSADNPRNPHDPPRTVVYGPDSTDEMAELWLQAVPRDPGDLPALREAANLKAWADRVAGWRHLVEVNPQDGWAHARLAAAYEARGQTHLALQHYRLATDIDPDLEDAHFGLALILEQRGETAEALAHYREATRAFPKHAAAHNNAGNLLFYEGRAEEAEQHYRLAIEADPQRAETYVNLGNLLRDQGRTQEALRQYRTAVETSPALPDVHMNLAFNLILLGEPDEALEHLQELARLAPRAVEPHLSAAWMLATHPDASARRPESAIALVEAVQKVMHDHPLVLDALAAAHAAAGRFERAAEIAAEALRGASAAGEPELARQIQARLELYLEGRPFVSELPGG